MTFCESEILSFAGEIKRFHFCREVFTQKLSREILGRKRYVKPNEKWAKTEGMYFHPIWLVEVAYRSQIFIKNLTARVLCAVAQHPVSLEQAFTVKMILRAEFSAP